MYCCIIWHFCRISDTKKIEKMQLKALRHIYKDYTSSGACPGGGPRGLGPPPLEIEKQKKKKKKKGHQKNIKLFHIYFVTFLVENIIFSASF